MNNYRRPDTLVASSPTELQDALVEYLQEIYDKSEQIPGYVTFAVSGGSMPKVLAGVFPRLKMDIDRLKVVLVDERVVEWSSPDSNYGAYISALPERYHDCVVPVELAEATYRQGGDKFPYDITRTASSYEHRIRQHIGPELIGRMPRFDAVLLGMGPDGHTASLFPNSRLWKLKNYQLDSPSWIVAIDDSPKQPPRRITFTLGAINCAKNIAFIATGEDKATVLKEVLEGNPMFPAALVRPCYNGGTLKFFVDRAAASKIV